MLELKFYFSLMLLFAVNTEKNIVIVGKAQNEKDGAWVMSTKDKKRYYLDGSDQWNEKMVGKTVKVWGVLKTEKLKEIPHQPGFPYPQQMIGVKRIILNSHWELVKK